MEAFNNFFADGKPDTAPRTICTVQSLKGLKDLGLMLGRDANSIIFTGKQPFPAQFLSRDVNLRRGLTPVMNCVPDQILKDLNETGPIDTNTR